VFIQGLCSLSISALPILKMYYKELKNISIFTKNYFFTVNKWNFTTLKSIPYKKNLTFSCALTEKSSFSFFAVYDVFA